MRMIRGKYDSLWKWNYQSTARGSKPTKLRRGIFATAMSYARRVKGGVASIQHARNQPWETWHVQRLTN